MSLGQGVSSKEEFDRVLHKVLSDPRYWKCNEKLKKAADSLFKKFQKWIEDLIASKFDNVNNVGDISRLISMVVIVIVGIALIVALIILGRYIYQSISGTKKLREILGEKITSQTTPITLKEKGSRYEKEGQYRLATRYSYISLLLLMHQKKLLLIQDAMTNAEIYEALYQSEYKKIETFKEIMDVFNYVWYGEHEYDEQSYDAYKQKLISLWNEVMIYEKG